MRGITEAQVKPIANSIIVQKMRSDLIDVGQDSVNPVVREAAGQARDALEKLWDALMAEAWPDVLKDVA